MKTFKVNIHPELEEVEETVRNGAQFVRSVISGEYRTFMFTTNEDDLQRIKEFAFKHATDKDEKSENWYANCKDFAMGLCISEGGKLITINTYRPYGQYSASKK